MSAFGNLFSMESSNQETIQNYTGSFNVSDSNNIATSSTSNLDHVLNTEVQLGSSADLPKILPWVLGGAAGLLLIWALFTD